MSNPLRVGYLGSYLRELIRDMDAQGKVVKIEGNPVQVAAVAVLSGSIAVVAAMFEDIKLLAGNAKTQAKPMVRPALEQIAGAGAGMLLDKIFGSKR